METQHITSQTSSSPSQPKASAGSAEREDRPREPGQFRALLERPSRPGVTKDTHDAQERPAQAPPATPLSAPAPVLLSGGPASGGLAAKPAAPAPTCPAPTSVDEVLGRAARDVQLASDGRDRFLLRFELAQGELRGARISLESQGGVISAVAVAAEAAQGPRLEQALEAARHALEARGIDVAGMEVRPGPGGREGRGSAPPDDDAPLAPALPGAVRPVTAPSATDPATSGIDYFV